MNKLKIMVLLGSTRQNRTSEKILDWAKPTIVDNPEAEFEFVDLRDWKMDYYNEPVGASGLKDESYTDKKAAEWSKKVAVFDGFLFFVPEYNHSFPAVVKNAMDLTYKPWNNKPIGFVSWGTVGGARSVEQLRLVAIELQMAPIREQVTIPLWSGGADERGIPKDQYKDNLNKTLNQLIWWGKTLKAAREQ